MVTNGKRRGEGTLQEEGVKRYNLAIYKINNPELYNKSPTYE